MEYARPHRLDDLRRRPLRISLYGRRTACYGPTKVMEMAISNGTDDWIAKGLKEYFAELERTHEPAHDYERFREDHERELCRLTAIPVTSRTALQQDRIGRCREILGLTEGAPTPD
jgi:hypothetical protein